MIIREIYKNLEKHLSKKEITLIVGARQTGKTTLMLLLEEKLKKRSKKTIFLSLDNEQDREYFKSQAGLINFLKLNLGDSKGYVFIDEIQRKDNAGLFLKGIYDQNFPYKFIVSGSGSLELKEKIHESLAGRKEIFEVMPISLKEFINYKTEYKYENKIMDFFKYDKNLPQQLFEEYVKYGGYPRVITSETHDDKVSSIREIYTSYIEKDIMNLLNIQKSESFSNLITILSSQIGQIVNYSELSSTLDLDINTIKRYLWYLRKTFINIKVSPYFKNIRKELIKAPVFYFMDLGMRNYAFNRLSYFNLLQDGGFLFQNLVLLLLKDKYPDTKINYWRSKGGSEVDFILNVGIKAYPIEVKYKNLKNANISKSIISYINEYNPEKFFVVNKNYTNTYKVNNTNIKFIPYYQLMEMLLID
ncbi:MAG: ATP-binding protein [Patescibacteria group bacterium]